MQLRRLFLFFVLLVALCGVLLYPWKPVERGHAAMFRGIGNVFFSRFWFWGEGRVRFIDLYAKDVRAEVERATPVSLPPNARVHIAKRELDTLMVCMNRNVPTSFGQIRISSRIVGYWPLAFLAALVIAKPMPLSRKLRALIFGLLLTELFILIRLSLHMMDACFAAPKKYAIFEWGEGARSLLHEVKVVMVDNPTCSFVMPLVIWIFVAFSRAEWNWFFELFGSVVPEPPRNREKKGK